jgi:hypothetical protein
MIGQSWKENDRITIKIKRNGAEQILQGKIKLPYEEKEALNATGQKTLRTAWLKVKTKILCQPNLKIDWDFLSNSSNLRSKLSNNFLYFKTLNQ